MGALRFDLRANVFWAYQEACRATGLPKRLAPLLEPPGSGAAIRCTESNLFRRKKVLRLTFSARRGKTGLSFCQRGREPAARTASRSPELPSRRRGQLRPRSKLPPTMKRHSLAQRCCYQARAAERAASGG